MPCAGGLNAKCHMLHRCETSEEFRSRCLLWRAWRTSMNHNVFAQTLRVYYTVLMTIDDVCFFRTESWTLAKCYCYEIHYCRVTDGLVVLEQ